MSDVDTTEEAEALLESVVRAMVHRPDDVFLDVQHTMSGAVHAEIHVHEGDIGLVLGRNRGSRARGLEDIFAAVYGKLHHRFTLRVHAPPRNGR